MLKYICVLSVFNCETTVEGWSMSKYFVSDGLSELRREKGLHKSPAKKLREGGMRKWPGWKKLREEFPVSRLRDEPAWKGERYKKEEREAKANGKYH